MNFNVLSKSLVLAVLILSIFAAGPALAGPDKLAPLLGPYMTLGETVTAQLNQEFAWEETPYVFLQFDRSHLNATADLTLAWKWFPEQAPTIQQDLHITDYTGYTETETDEDDIELTTVNIWSHLDDWKDVGGPRKVGDWELMASWKDGNGANVSEKISFTVNPEPVSTVLFLAGAAPLGMALRRKKKVT